MSNKSLKSLLFISGAMITITACNSTSTSTVAAKAVSTQKTNDVAAKYPEIVAKMNKLMTTQRTPTLVEKWQFLITS